MGTRNGGGVRMKIGQPTERVRRAVFDSAREIINTKGFSAFTIDELVARSGVSKTTIYRWWNNRADVTMDLLLDAAGPNEPIIHPGSALDNLRSHIRIAGEFIGGPSGHLLAGIVADAQHDSALSEAFRQRYLARRRKMTIELLTMAIDEGSLRPDLDPELVVDVLIGPLYYRLLLQHLPPGPEAAQAVLEMVLTGLAAG